MSSALALLPSETLSRVMPVLEGLGFAMLPPSSDHPTPDVVLADVEHLQGATGLKRADGKAAPLLVLADPMERGALADLLEFPSFAALIAARTATVNETLERHLREVTSDFQPAGPPPALTTSIRSSHEREAVLAQIESTLAAAGVRQRVIARAVNALEELITNAVYDAPTGADGRHLHLTTDRRMSVAMPSHAYPTLSLGVDGGLIHATMADPFGSLSVASLKTHLARGLRGDFADKAGGAGLGFARIYAAVDDLHVRVIPGKSTRVSITLDTTAQRRDPAARPNGLFVLERA